jgi:Xaa-Pro dipeptidase
MLLFERGEYQTRIENTKRRMNEVGLDLLVVADPANMNYLTGYDGWSFYVPQIVLLHLDAEEPVWIGRMMDTTGARCTTFLAPDNIIGYPDDYVQNLIKHPMNFVADCIKELGWERQNIGVEMDAYYFSARGYEALRENLPQATFIDGNLLVNWVRIIKSEREIIYMKQAGKIIESVMQTALDTIAPGVRECDAVAEIYRAQMRGTPEFGGDYPSIVPMMPTGEKTSTPHLTWSDTPYENEQAVNMELAGCRHRYHSPMSRTLYLGKKPPQILRDTAAIVVEGTNATLGFIKPGVTCEEVEAVWRKTIARIGLVKDSRMGYPIGVNYPPDWGEHTASFRPTDRTVLQPNMAFHLMPGIWKSDWGFVCSEAFYVTETGCETFANFPRRLFIKG